MSFADNWARVFVVITFLTFGEAQIMGGLVPNLIALGLFLRAIGYFALTGKKLRCFAGKRINSCYQLNELLSNFSINSKQVHQQTYP